jgi:cell division protein FtsN
MSSDARAFDSGDDGFHEIQLNGKQLVFLGMATTLVSVVIFLCGVLVGRGVKPIDTVAQAAGPQAFDAPATPAAVPPGTVSTPAPAPVPPPAPAPSAATASAAAAAATTPAEDDTQPTPVGDDPDTAAPSSATEHPSPAAAKPSVEPHAAAKATPKPEAPKPAAKPAQATIVPPAVKPVTPAPTPAPPAAAPKPAPKPAPALAPALASTAAASPSGAIAVQVGAFKTRSEADTLAKRLSGKGYAVYVMNPAGDGKPVYRVRVGNYATADEAKNVSARLTQQEKLKPWITR